MSNEECRSFRNGIWLCNICARKVDVDWRKYEPDVLRRWKEDTEVYVESLSTQDSRLRQLRALVAPTLSALRYLTALPGPGPNLDQTYSAGGLPISRIFLEGEQLLFENSFEREAGTVLEIADELEYSIRPVCRRLMDPQYLDISCWKNDVVKKLMIDVMQFSQQAYERYLRREAQLVKAFRQNVEERGYMVVPFNFERVSLFRDGWSEPNR